MPLIHVQSLTKVFGDRPNEVLELLDEGLDRDAIYERTGQTVGVAEVTFEVERGEIVVVMGLSGSGKSTLIRCLNRLIEPTRGVIEIDGGDVVRMSRKQLLQLRRRTIGMVFQHFALFPHRTVLDNAAYGLEVVGRPRREREAKAREVLELVGLKGHERDYPDQLSGGMQQRVGLARALAGEPEIILMDEALSALDPLIRKEMQGELIELQQRLQKTIVFITHDLDEAVRMGDRIVLMKDGRVVQQGTAEEVLTHPASEYVAQFVEDVDMSVVLTAESVMQPPREVLGPGEGPADALRKMKRHGLSAVFVVDESGKLRGVVHADRAARLARTGKSGTGIEAEMIEQQLRRVRPDTHLQSVVPLMAERPEPVAVVDESGVLRGVVVRGALLAGLAEGVSHSESRESAEPSTPLSTSYPSSAQDDGS